MSAARVGAIHFTATMKHLMGSLAVVAALLGHGMRVVAQQSSDECPSILKPSNGDPVVGSGWTAQLIAQNLTAPRSIVFDQNGALLVVQKGSGIVRITFTDNGGTCLVVNQTTTVVDNADVSAHCRPLLRTRNISSDAFG